MAPKPGEWVRTGMHFRVGERSAELVYTSSGRVYHAFFEFHTDHASGRRGIRSEPVSLMWNACILVRTTQSSACMPERAKRGPL